MRRSGTIGVLIPQRLSTVFANPFVSELIQGLGEQCEEHDLTLLLVPPLDGSLEGAIRQASVDGFISLGLSPDDRALEVLDRIGIPTVLVDSDTSPSHPAVNIDDDGGALDQSAIDDGASADRREGPAGRSTPDSAYERYEGGVAGSAQHEPRGTQIDLETR